MSGAHSDCSGSVFDRHIIAGGSRESIPIDGWHQSWGQPGIHHRIRSPGDARDGVCNGRCIINRKRIAIIKSRRRSSAKFCCDIDFISSTIAQPTTGRRNW